MLPNPQTKLRFEGIRTEDVIDLGNGEIVISVGVVIHAVAVKECHERRVHGIAQVRPTLGVEIGEPAGSISDAAIRAADRPEIQNSSGDRAMGTSCRRMTLRQAHTRRPSRRADHRDTTGQP